MVVVYRPPHSGEHKVPTSVFFDEFSAYLESLLLCKERLLICGDFNIHVDSADDPDSVKFRDLLESVGLRQHVKKSTHNDGHILDLIITRFTDSTICKEPQVMVLTTSDKQNSRTFQGQKLVFKDQGLFNQSTLFVSFFPPKTLIHNPFQFLNSLCNNIL